MLTGPMKNLLVCPGWPVEPQIYSVGVVGQIVQAVEPEREAVQCDYGGNLHGVRFAIWYLARRLSGAFMIVPRIIPSFQSGWFLSRTYSRFCLNDCSPYIAFLIRFAFLPFMQFSFQS
jgi:hypothetical protein